MSAVPIADELERMVLAGMPRLRSQAMRLCHDRQRADDLAQEAVCTFFEQRERWPGTGNLGAWIFAIMRNQYLASLKKSARETDDPEGIIIGNATADDDQGDAYEHKEVLTGTLAAIEDLPPECRELMLDLAEGLDTEEIARRRGLSAGMVKSRIQRGRLLLREKIYLEAIPVGQIAEEQTRQIIGLEAKDGIKPAVLPSAFPEIGKSDPRDLMVEPAYQRDLSQKSIKMIQKIVAGWDWTKFKPPICARTETGMFVIDGQHTAIAAASHPDINEIPILIVSADYIGERAAAFVSHNRDRLAMTPAQIFYGDLIAGDEAAKGIMEVVVKVGASIPRLPVQKDQWKAGQVSAIGELRAAWKGVKRDKFERILRIAVQSGVAPVSKTLLRAVRALATEKRFRQVWGQSDLAIVEAIASIADIEASSEQYAVNLGISRFNACAELVAERVKCGP